MADMSCLRREDMKIFRRVIELISIDVVNHFTRKKGSSEFSLSNDYMLVDIAIRMRAMVLRCVDAPVSVRHRCPALPGRAVFSRWAMQIAQSRRFLRWSNTILFQCPGYLLAGLSAHPATSESLGTSGNLGFRALGPFRGVSTNEPLWLPLDIATIRPILGGNGRWLAAATFTEFDRHSSRPFSSILSRNERRGLLVW